MDGQRWGSCCFVTTGVYGVRVISSIASLCATVVGFVVHPAATLASIDLVRVTKPVPVVAARGGGELFSGSSGPVGVVCVSFRLAIFS